MTGKQLFDLEDWMNDVIYNYNYLMIPDKKVIACIISTGGRYKDQYTSDDKFTVEFFYDKDDLNFISYHVSYNELVNIYKDSETLIQYVHEKIK